MTLVTPDAGPRLGDRERIINAINNLNQVSRLAAITATGSTLATAKALVNVINEVDTVTSSTGVSLPPTSGLANTAFMLCVVINNGANSLTVYGAAGDTINGTAGTTGLALANGKTALYVSAKKGAWFCLLSA